MLSVVVRLETVSRAPRILTFAIPIEN